MASALLEIKSNKSEECRALAKKSPLVQVGPETAPKMHRLFKKQ